MDERKQRIDWFFLLVSVSGLGFQVIPLLGYWIIKNRRLLTASLFYFPSSIFPTLEPETCT